MVPTLKSRINKKLLDLIGWEDPSECRLLVVTGENAAGKSVARRCLQVASKDAGMECMAISIELQTSQSIGVAFVFDSESDSATGITRAQTLKAGISTSRKRKKPHTMVFDEPEIGMSEELQHASAAFLVRELADWPKRLEGLVLMTHSRIFVERLVDGAGAAFLNLGGAYPTAEAWLARDVRAGERDIEAILDDANERFLAFAKLFK